jgi:hypothetical protein
MRVSILFLAFGAVAAAVFTACSSGTSAPATTSARTATSAPATATTAAAAGATAVSTATATATATSATTATGKVSANNASHAEIQAALQAAGVASAAQWAREVTEYRPYPANDPTFAKLRQNLAKYNPGPGVVDQIISALALP